MTGFTISAMKANRLYWLGRYVERAYVGLHLMRRYFDRQIDGGAAPCEEFCRKLEVDNPYADAASFQAGYMFDEGNPCSLASSLRAAHDNAIVLREEITSETLGYVEMALDLVKAAGAGGCSNVTALQPVTDYLLAFWGSVDERVADDRARHILKTGKLVEDIDMHLRFDYPFSRVQETYAHLKVYAAKEGGCFDRMMLAQMDELMGGEREGECDGACKARLLKYVNHLVLL